MKKKDRITIKFHAQKEFCHCCDRKLDEVKRSETREFDFYEKQLREDVNWKLYDESELEEVVRGYVSDVIEFFAVGAHDRLILPEGEVNRMVEYVKENLM